LVSLKAYDFLKLITSAGSRLTGSPEADRAVEIASVLMRELGFDQVWTEQVKVERWVRGPAEEAVVRGTKSGNQTLKICALGNSVATPAAGIEAPVIEVRSFEELASLKERFLAG